MPKSARGPFAMPASSSSSSSSSKTISSSARIHHSSTSRATSSSSSSSSSSVILPLRFSNPSLRLRWMCANPARSLMGRAGGGRPLTTCLAVPSAVLRRCGGTWRGQGPQEVCACRRAPVGGYCTARGYGTSRRIVHSRRAPHSRRVLHSSIGCRQPARQKWCGAPENSGAGKEWEGGVGWGRGHARTYAPWALQARTLAYAARAGLLMSSACVHLGARAACPGLHAHPTSSLGWLLRACYARTCVGHLYEHKQLTHVCLCLYLCGLWKVEGGCERVLVGSCHTQSVLCRSPRSVFG